MGGGHAPRVWWTFPASLPRGDGIEQLAFASVNIEEFYEQDERRRESQELELGSDWHDAAGLRYDVSYVVDTGELYSMAAPVGEVGEDVFGDTAVMPEPVSVLTVEVLAVIPTVDEVHEALAGWQDHMSSPDSIEWLKGQVRTFPTP
ncbi:MAG TPA: hypothetical protein VKT18_06875 [Acidimicrobiales bacterium]|nr:hypothetical protein [Acidimicrobiales bacterium]